MVASICVDHAVSGLKTIFRYEFPNSVKVSLSLRVKPVAAH